MSTFRGQLRGLYGMVDIAPRMMGLSVNQAQPPAGRLARALLDAGVSVLQLRMKHVDAAVMVAVADEVGLLCRRRGALFIVNDRLDVALASGAHGVHLGQGDLPLEEARRVAPAGFVIGQSTHSLEQAERAAADGADYIGFGPIFATSSKDNPDPVVGVEALAAVCRVVQIPVVAIGGISLATVGAVARAGAAAAAIISAVNQHDSDEAVTAAARQVMAAFAA